MAYNRKSRDDKNRSIIDFMRGKPAVTYEDLCYGLGLAESTARPKIRTFIHRGIVEFIGSIWNGSSHRRKVFRLRKATRE